MILTVLRLKLHNYPWSNYMKRVFGVIVILHILTIGEECKLYHSNVKFNTTHVYHLALGYIVLKNDRYLLVCSLFTILEQCSHTL